MARVAREQPEAAAPVEHAHREPVGAPRSASASGSVSSRAPGGCSRRSTTTTRGQPATSTSGGGTSGAKPTTASASTVGAADTTVHCAPARRAPLEQDVARVPRRHPLFLQRFVGVVDDDRGREVGHRRERRDPAADDDAPPAAARRHASVRAAADSSECSSATR